MWGSLGGWWNLLWVSVPSLFDPQGVSLHMRSWGGLLDTKNDRCDHLLLTLADLISSLLLALAVVLEVSGEANPNLLHLTYFRKPSTSYFNSVFYYLGYFKQISSRTTFLIWKRETTPIPPLWITWWMMMIKSPCSSNSHSFCCYQLCNWTMVLGGN